MQRVAESFQSVSDDDCWMVRQMRAFEVFADELDAHLYLFATGDGSVASLFKLLDAGFITHIGPDGQIGIFWTDAGEKRIGELKAGSYERKVQSS